ncbi:MAG: DUF308 domain-containing protein [Oscillospiraceae bacterium]
MEENSKPILQFDWYNLLTALIMIIIGITIFINPNESSRLLAYVIAALVTILGTVRTALYFIRKERYSPFSVGGLSIGLTIMAVGIVLLVDPNILVMILPIALGCLLLFSGFGSLQTAIDLCKIRTKIWYVPLIFALISLVCGFIAVFNPFGTASVLMVFLGISLCTEGLLLLISVFVFKRRI